MNEFLLADCEFSVLLSRLRSRRHMPLPSRFRKGRTAQDRRFIAGGIGFDESEQMKSMARDFTLSITVAEKSGAYLADSHVKIQDAREK